MNTTVSAQGFSLKPSEEREQEKQSYGNPNFQDENYVYEFSYCFSYSGPLSKCLEMEDDVLCDDSLYVPSQSTLRVRVYLPNRHPLWIVSKRDATVQDVIELTIRKSNALAKRFQRLYEQRKEEQERKRQADKSPNDISSPPSETSPPPQDPSLSTDSPPERVGMEGRNNSLDGLTEFLANSELESNSRRRGGPSFAGGDDNAEVRVDDLMGWKALTLLTDCMAYELRMEIGDGECDLDFPGKEWSEE